MAKKAKRITDAVQNEPRTDLSWRHGLLWSVFGLLVIASIFTVLVPELTDDGAEEEAEARGTTEVVSDAPPASAAAAAPAPSAAP